MSRTLVRELSLQWLDGRRVSAQAAPPPLLFLGRRPARGDPELGRRPGRRRDLARRRETGKCRGSAKQSAKTVSVGPRGRGLAGAEGGQHLPPTHRDPGLGAQRLERSASCKHKAGAGAGRGVPSPALQDSEPGDSANRPGEHLSSGIPVPPHQSLTGNEDAFPLSLPTSPGTRLDSRYPLKTPKPKHRLE